LNVALEAGQHKSKLTGVKSECQTTYHQTSFY
jgi:hypothetical protein